MPRRAAAADSDDDGRSCHHCGVTHSRPWRLDLRGTGKPSCNACRGYQESHGGELPPPEALAKRQRLREQRQREAEQGLQQGELRCEHCGTDRSPDGWMLNPAPGSSGRLCQPCTSYWRVYARLPPEETLQKRRQRQAERQQGGPTCGWCGSDHTSGVWLWGADGRRLCNACHRHREVFRLGAAAENLTLCY